MSDEQTKESIMNVLLSAREKLETALSGVPKEQMQEPILHDGWSVQDMLGHITFWEERAVDNFASLRAGQTPDPITDMDAINARTLSEFRHFSLEEVRQREQAAYQHVLDMLETASEDELFNPQHFAWTNGNPFVAWIAGDTWDHYDEHLAELQAWLDANPQS
jgi:hypothetical protein